MSEDPDFDMEVVGDDELDDMGADGTSSSADDGTRSDRKTTGVEVPEHSRSDSNRGTGTDEGTASANREEKIFERGGDVEGWKEKTLGSIFDSIYSGGTPKKGVDEYYGGDLPFVKIEDLNRQQGKGISSAETHITEKAVEETSTRAFDAGTLLLTIYGSLAETALVRNRVATNQAILGLWDTEEENTLYVKYAIDYDQAKLQSLSRQTTQANLGKGIVAKHRLSVPPLPEQRKIASVLHAVDQAIQKTEVIIEQAKRVKRGLMQKFFREGFGGYADYVESHHRNCLHRHPTAWEVLPAEKVMEVSRGSHPRPKSDSSLWGGDIPIIKIGDRDRGDQRRITATTDTVTEKGSDSSKRVPEGTLIVSNAGTCGVARIAGMGACIHDHWLILRDYEERLDTRYLFYYINYNQNFLATLASGSTVDDLNTDDFRLFDIAIPPLEEQQKIAATLDGLHDEILQSKSKVDRLKRLKKGLMQDLLTGEVRTMDKAIEVLGEVNAHG